MKEAFHPCDFQSVVDPPIHAHQPQTASIFLSRDIGPDQRPNPRRIHQRNSREVQNQGVRVVRTHLRLKAEYIEKREWPARRRTRIPARAPGRSSMCNGCSGMREMLTANDRANVNARLIPLRRPPVSPVSRVFRHHDLIYNFVRIGERCAPESWRPRPRVRTPRRCGREQDHRPLPRLSRQTAPGHHLPPARLDPDVSQPGA